MCVGIADYLDRSKAHRAIVVLCAAESPEREAVGIVLINPHASRGLRRATGGVCSRQAAAGSRQRHWQ